MTDATGVLHLVTQEAMTAGRLAGCYLAVCGNPVLTAGPGTFGPSGNAHLAGALFETTVLTEIAKQATWSEHLVDLAHFRDRNGPEVDLIVEDRRTGALAGVEVKLSASPTAWDARHLALLRDGLGTRFTVGLVIHTGAQSLPLGERFWAVPITALWRDDA